MAEPMAMTFRLDRSYPNAIKFSPFSPSQLACASAENYGLHGKGFGHVFQFNSSGVFTSSEFVWRDNLMDLSWSETQPDLMVTAGGDGTVQLWNIHQPHSAIRVYCGHQTEVNSVQWNQTRTGDNFLSGSCDQTVKLWDVHSATCLHSYNHHKYYVYNAVWSPQIKDLFASVSGDACLRLWNIQQDQPAFVIPAHNAEVLSCDWSKHDQHLIATGATDGLIRYWDIRNPTAPLTELPGHSYAVKRLLFSPHDANILVSISYDFTTRRWTTTNGVFNSCDVFTHHSEFVCGLDLSLHVHGLIADCSWDKLIHIFIPEKK